MKLDELIQIKSEIKRFSDTIDEAIKLARLNKGYTRSDGILYGAHDISGTRMAGAVKRRAMDLKHYLTQKL
jgi:hypothetical protein